VNVSANATEEKNISYSLEFCLSGNFIIENRILSVSEVDKFSVNEVFCVCKCW